MVVLLPNLQLENISSITNDDYGTGRRDGAYKHWYNILCRNGNAYGTENCYIFCWITVLVSFVGCGEWVFIYPKDGK